MVPSPQRAEDAGDGRSETAEERYDRNWAEILQELRVLQTGTQILTGFLLTVVFQPRFDSLTPWEVRVYLALVVLAVIAVVLGLAPVALHRLLFRRGAKGAIVAVADRLLLATLVTVALLFSGTAGLIFDIAVGTPAALVVVVLSLVLAAALWVALPLGTRRRHGQDERAP